MDEVQRHDCLVDGGPRVLLAANRTGYILYGRDKSLLVATFSPFVWLATYYRIAEIGQ